MCDSQSSSSKQFKIVLKEGHWTYLSTCKTMSRCLPLRLFLFPIVLSYPKQISHYPKKAVRILEKHCMMPVICMRVWHSLYSCSQ